MHFISVLKFETAQIILIVHNYVIVMLLGYILDDVEWHNVTNVMLSGLKAKNQTGNT